MVDRLVLREGVRARLADSVETALRWGKSQLIVLHQPPARRANHWEETAFSTDYRDPQTGFTLPALTAKHFSFNSHLGACPTCHGLGVLQVLDPELMVPDPHENARWKARSPPGTGAWASGCARFTRRSCADWRRIYGAPMDKPFADLPESVPARAFLTARATTRSAGTRAWSRIRHGQAENQGKEKAEQVATVEETLRGAGGSQLQHPVGHHQERIDANTGSRRS